MRGFRTILLLILSFSFIYPQAMPVMPKLKDKPEPTLTFDVSPSSKAMKAFELPSSTRARGAKKPVCAIQLKTGAADVETEQWKIGIHVVGPDELICQVLPAKNSQIPVEDFEIVFTTGKTELISAKIVGDSERSFSSPKDFVVEKNSVAPGTRWKPQTIITMMIKNGLHTDNGFYTDPIWYKQLKQNNELL